MFVGRTPAGLLGARYFCISHRQPWALFRGRWSPWNILILLSLVSKVGEVGLGHCLVCDSLYPMIEIRFFRAPYRMAPDLQGLQVWLVGGICVPSPAGHWTRFPPNLSGHSSHGPRCFLRACTEGAPWPVEVALCGSWGFLPPVCSPLPYSSWQLLATLTALASPLIPQTQGAPAPAGCLSPQQGRGVSPGRECGNHRVCLSGFRLSGAGKALHCLMSSGLGTSVPCLRSRFSMIQARVWI